MAQLIEIAPGMYIDIGEIAALHVSEPNTSPPMRGFSSHEDIDVEKEIPRTIKIYLKGGTELKTHNPEGIQRLLSHLELDPPT